MNKQEKKTFIKTYLKNISNDILADVSKMPENWDGIELRELVAERAKDSSGYLVGERKREFKNDCIINNI